MTPRGHWIHLGHTFEIEVEGETYRFTLRWLASMLAPELTWPHPSDPNMTERRRYAMRLAIIQYAKRLRDAERAASTMHAIKPDGRRELVPFQLRLPRLTWFRALRRWLRYGGLRDSIPTARALPPRRSSQPATRTSTGELIMGLDEDDAEIMKECARHLGAIAKVATATAAAEDPAAGHLERIATALSSIAESEAAVAEASLKRCAVVAEVDAANLRVALLNEQILARDLAAAPVPLSAAVEAMLRVAELQAAHLTATHQHGLQVGRYGDLAVRLPVFEVYSAGWVQWDPVTYALRRWMEADQLHPEFHPEFHAGWGAWAGAYDLSPPSDETLCRAVPRGEADASPMSRGPLAPQKAEG